MRLDVSRNPRLIEAVTTAVRDQGLKRTAVTSTTYSVGAAYDAILPTVGFMTYPHQMLSWGIRKNGRFSQHLNRVDPVRMSEEIKMLARVLDAVDSMPTATLAAGTQLADSLD
ncbi:hypothetical protein [Streptomyces sp. NPDC058683]|uniref:hypothetical protein n=1 Tax=Streptomyces sp. NPDC058683 TaxID=3346597 RepID=UPI003653AC5D